MQIANRSLREAVFAHSQGGDHAFRRPVKVDRAPELGGHAPVYQLAAEAFECGGSRNRRSTPFGPHDHDLVVPAITRYVQRAAYN